MRMWRCSGIKRFLFEGSTWVVVKIMVPFWVPNIVRHLIFRVPKKNGFFWVPQGRRLFWSAGETGPLLSAMPV